MPRKNTNFKQLSKENRIVIETLTKQGCSQTMIADEIGCHKSTISREINNPKNKTAAIYHIGNKIKYTAQTAWENHVVNKSKCGANCKAFLFRVEVKYIEEQVIKKKWSPHIAVKYANINNFTDRTVYNWIKNNQCNIKPHHLRFSLRTRQKKKEIKENIRKMGKSITLRPATVNNRTEFGHWEADCIIGHHGQAILVLQERKTRLFKMKRLDRHNSFCALGQAVKWLDKNIKSITCDNGSEFARFSELPTDIYFTHPFAPHEKGSVENLNGIIRRFIPKGTSLNRYSDTFVQNVCDTINNTPRKILNYKTPSQMFDFLTKNDTVSQTHKMSLCCN